MRRTNEQLKSEGWSDQWIHGLETLEQKYPDYTWELSYEGMDGLSYARAVLVGDELVEIEVGRVEVDNPEYPDYDYSDVGEWKDGHMYVNKVIRSANDEVVSIEQLEIL